MWYETERSLVEAYISKIKVEVKQNDPTQSTERKYRQTGRTYHEIGSFHPSDMHESSTTSFYTSESCDPPHSAVL